MDGAPLMMRKNIGLLRILLREYPHIKINHCIIHCQSLASKDLSPNFSDVMQVVVSTVNHVKARDLNFRMFKQFCVTGNSNHNTLEVYNGSFVARCVESEVDLRWIRVGSKVDVRWI